VSPGSSRRGSVDDFTAIETTQTQPVLPAGPADKLQQARLKALREAEARVAELEAQLAILRRAQLCQVCATHERNATLLPCLHAIFCAECVRGLARCPVCSIDIAGVLMQRLTV